MAWIKKAEPVQAPLEEIPAFEEEKMMAAEEPDEKPGEETAEHPANRRYSRHGTRRGQRRYVAVLGLIVLIFALIGVISTVVTGYNIIKKARDTSYLREDMYYTLLPLMQYAPTAFDNVNDSKQDALIQAALYHITNREYVRQQQDSEYVTPYDTDEFGRTMVPIADVTAAYNELFGADTVPYCHTFGDDAGAYFTYEYNEEENLYYVPYSTTSSAYEPVLDTIQRVSNFYKVRVGYVHLQDITVDDHGNQVIDIAHATYFQLYTVERLEDGSFVIRSVADETTEKK